jgi:predicted phage terminase large subunit-like protein
MPAHSKGSATPSPEDRIRSHHPRLTNSRSPRSLAQLAAIELAKIRSARTEATIQAAKPYRPHPPSKKQRAFLELECREAFYGGAAGGGKSDALIMGALQYVDVPGYRAILFRKTRVDLEKDDAIKARADAWFAGTAATWDPKMYAWRFPTRGEDATISFGYLEGKADRDRYQGPAYQFIGIDELVQWDVADYRWLFSRLRRLEKNRAVPLRMRGAGNPGGRGHEEFKARFVEHARQDGSGLSYRQYLEMRRRRERLPDPPYFRSPPSKEAIALAEELGEKAEGAVFVPAFSEDNPGLDVKSYRMNLVELDDVERRQLDEGDWDAIQSGKVFRAESFRYIDAHEVPDNVRRGRYWDLAATDPTKRKKPGKDPDWSAGALLAIHQDATNSIDVYIEDVRRMKKEPGDVEREIRATAEQDGKLVPVWIEEEPGSAGKANSANYATRILPGWTVEGHRKTGPKPSYWKPLASLAKHGRVYLVRGSWNAEFVRELVGLTLDDSHSHDDQADAAAGCFDRLLESKDAMRALMMANGIR